MQRLCYRLAPAALFLLAPALVLLAPALVSAGTVQLAGDPDFALFPETCNIPGDTGCWLGVPGLWVDTVGDGNDQMGGSEQPSAQCNGIPEGAGAPEGTFDCQILQCIDISAIPVGTAFQYGFAYRLLEAAEVLQTGAGATSNNDCSGASEIRDFTAHVAQVGAWTTAASDFASQAGDASILIALSIILTADELAGGSALAGRGGGNGVLRIDDGFLIADIAEATPTPIATLTPTVTPTPTATPTPPGGGVSPLEIPTASNVGLALLAALVLLSAVALARRLPRGDRR